jgi:hypothetical protein
MNELRSVRASAVAGASPIFVIAAAGPELFEERTGSRSTTMMILDSVGHGIQWHQPVPELTVADDLEDDIEAGLAALDEPVVDTWESVKERLGL